jgi:hypothetical protein
LIPIDDFKAILNVDSREDKLATFCLITATYTIESYCRRKLLHKKHDEWLEYSGDLFLPLRDYPVREVISISNEQLAMSNEEGRGDMREGRAIRNKQLGMTRCLIVEPDLYRIVPWAGMEEDIPQGIAISPALVKRGDPESFKIIYLAGYRHGSVPADLASACLELAAWNMTRYRGRRIGVTGMVRGTGKDGEHLEASMPENVKLLLEPYERKTI